jgi:hypothetical protein
MSCVVIRSVLQSYEDAPNVEQRSSLSLADELQSSAQSSPVRLLHADTDSHTHVDTPSCQRQCSDTYTNDSSTVSSTAVTSMHLMTVHEVARQDTDTRTDTLNDSCPVSSEAEETSVLGEHNEMAHKDTRFDRECLDADAQTDTPNDSCSVCSKAEESIRLVCAHNEKVQKERDSYEIICAMQFCVSLLMYIVLLCGQSCS